MTFTFAQKLGTTPFDIMAQDLDWVIMVINHYLGRAETNNANESLSEKDRDRDFWSAL